MQGSADAAMVARGEALLAARLNSMLWGVRWNIGGLILTGVIFLLKEDKLRTFLEENTFGTKGRTKLLSAARQRSILKSAIVEIV